MSVAEDTPAVASAPSCRVLAGDALTQLCFVDSESIHCVVTSPPYWALRDYQGPVLDFAPGRYAPLPGVPALEYPAWRGQLGLEPTPEMFIGHLVEIFREVRRVLRTDGTCWVNMGDCYRIGAEAKQLLGQPWRLAFALQADGWYLRQDIVWAKPNPMPESVRDRCTKAHEYLFLLTKSPSYCFDAGAIKEPVSGTAHPRGSGLHRKIMPTGWAVGPEPRSAAALNTTTLRPRAFGRNSRIRDDRDPAHQTPARTRAKQNRSFSAAVAGLVDRRNKRSVWSIAPRAYRGAHFATFPPALVEPCILAGCPVGGTVLDPFGGSGTTASVALRLGRHAVTIELNPDYIPLIEERLKGGAV